MWLTDKLHLLSYLTYLLTYNGFQSQAEQIIRPVTWSSKPRHCYALASQPWPGYVTRLGGTKGNGGRWNQKTRGEGKKWGRDCKTMTNHHIGVDHLWDTNMKHILHRRVDRYTALQRISLHVKHLHHSSVSDLLTATWTGTTVCNMQVA